MITYKEYLTKHKASSTLITFFNRNHLFGCNIHEIQGDYNGIIDELKTILNTEFFYDSFGNVIKSIYNTSPKTTIYSIL